MSKQRVHAVIGKGEASSETIAEGLKDILEDGDALGLVWAPPHTASQDSVMEFVLDREIPFVMYYKDGTNPHKLFREADWGIVQKVRNPLKSALEGVDNGGAVLFLWSDDENPEDDDTLIDFVFDTLGEEQLVLALDHGLAPISVSPPVPIPAPEEVAAPVEEEDDEVKPFTKDELEGMPAPAVKQYGAKVGAKGTTKTAIIAELFPEDSSVDAVVDKAVTEYLDTELDPNSVRPTHEIENTAEFLPLAKELRRFATAAIRLANALDAERKD